MWNKEDTEFNGTLSFEEGLEEIDSFYTSQETPQDEPELLGAVTAAEDEFTTLIDDIELLTAGDSHDVTQAASGIEFRSLANQSTWEGGIIESFLHPIDTADQVVNMKQPSPNADIQGEIATRPHLSQTSQGFTSLDVQQKLTGELEHTQLAGLDDLPQRKGASLAPSPIPDLKMTPRNEENSHPLSTASKASLLDEMRSEERYPESNHNVKVEVPKSMSQIRLPGIDVKEEGEDFEGDNSTFQSKPEAPSSTVSMQAKLRDAAVSQKISPNVGVQYHPESDIVKSQVEEAQKTKADGESFPDLSVKSVDENFPTSTRTKRKKNTKSDGSRLKNSQTEIPVAKKTKTRVQKSDRQVPISTAGVESKPRQQAPRGTLGHNEMRRLTESVLLAGEIPTQGRSSGRQTRAQKEEEARKAPNAGRAAKERHMRK